MQAHSAITRRILVVCPKAADSQVLVIQEATRAWMFDTVARSSVKEAEELLKERDFDIIFCEERFNAEGYADVLSMVGRRYKVPVVVMISDADHGSVFREAMALGAFGVVPSPCSAKDVQWMVIRATRRGTSSKSAPISRAASAASNGLSSGE
jgi:DNA-binding NtrC family response regulator